MCPLEDGNAGSFPGLRIAITRACLPHLRKVMGADNRLEDLVQEGNRSLGKMLEGPVQYTFQARSFADFETPEGSVNLVRFFLT